MSKIVHITDTHFYHSLIKQQDTDFVIFSGDCSNPQDSFINEQQVRDFIEWYSQYPATHKIFIAGNHDASIERNLVTRSDFQSNGIIYLENDWVEIEGIKIWGSPITPTYNVGWAFNRARNKTETIWKHIPDDTDIIVTHGPPKGILDLAYHDDVLEFCGDKSLLNRVLQINPKLHLFGHIHNNGYIQNSGYTKVTGCDTIFSNATAVEDRKFTNGIINHGNVFHI